MTQRPAGRRPARTERDAASATPEFDLAESPLAWLARRKDKDGRALISDDEFNAGERLRADFWFARMTPRVTANWSQLRSGGAPHGAPDLGPDVQDHVIAAQQRVRRALAAAGPDLAGILIDVCCHLKGLEIAERNGGWPRRSGKVILQIALRQLARHYGIIASRAHGAASSEDSRAPRVHHWGAADYRPKIDSIPDDPTD
ncbi:MAG: DUF6456 domain-containing protein [Hyphomicrobium sp.]